MPKSLKRGSTNGIPTVPNDGFSATEMKDTKANRVKDEDKEFCAKLTAKMPEGDAHGPKALTDFLIELMMFAQRKNSEEHTAMVVLFLMENVFWQKLDSKYAKLSAALQAEGLLLIDGKAPQPPETVPKFVELILRILFPRKTESTLAVHIMSRVYLRRENYDGYGKTAMCSTAAQKVWLKTHWATYVACEKKTPSVKTGSKRLTTKSGDGKPQKKGRNVGRTDKLIMGLIGADDDLESLRAREVEAREKEAEAKMIEAQANAAKIKKETALLSIDEKVKILVQRKRLLDEEICTEEELNSVLPLPVEN